MLCSGPSGPWRVQNKAAMAKRDYLVEAAKQIHMALDSEVNEDYEAAFSYYKNGVDLLLNGVQRKWTTFGLSHNWLRLCDKEPLEEECLHKSCDWNMWTRIKTGSHKPRVKQRCSFVSCVEPILNPGAEVCSSQGHTAAVTSLYFALLCNRASLFL